MAGRSRDATPGSVTGRSLPAALEAAYRRAIYEVDAGERQIRLTVGRRSPPLDRLLAGRGVERAAFLSAANPRSQPLADAENRECHDRLLRRVAELGYAALPGESRDASGGWREASLLLLGLDENAAIALAREFGQAALLVVERGGAVQMLAAQP